MVVTDDFAVDHVDHVFGDVFGMVGNSLDVPDAGEAVQRGDDQFWIAGH